MQSFTLGDYLARIGLASVPGGPDGIAALQEAQLRAIPFENVDPLLGRVPDIALDAVAAKILPGDRGGYCFETNRLLGAALSALGYTPRPVLARVRQGAPVGGARGHFAYIVETGGRRLLADAGFGGPGPLSPPDLDLEGPQSLAGGVYRLVADAEETVLQKETPEGWFSLFGFDDVPVREADLVMSNHFMASAPQAKFASNLMVSGWSDDTKIGLFNRALTRESPRGRDTATLESLDDLREILCAALGLRLDGETLAAVWARLPA